MTANLPPYSSYRPSGLSWLDQVPAHWDVRRNGQLFSQRKQTGFAELPILEVSLRTGVRIRRFDVAARKQVMSDRTKYKRAAKGDIAYNMMRMWQGAVGVAPEDGLISPAYVVASPLAGVESRYFSELFRTAAYMGEVDAHSHGIVKDRNRLYWEDFKQIFSVCPPSTEQRAMIRFIGHLDRLTARYLRAKQDLLVLLGEQKREIIRHSITQGLRDGGASRDSGADWLGTIPSHWTVRKLRHCASIQGGSTPNMSVERFWDGDIPWVTPKDMKVPVIGDSILHVTSTAVAETSLTLLRPGAVLLVVRGMILARHVPIACTSREVTVNQDMKALRPFSGLEPRFLTYFLTSAQAGFSSLIDESGHGTRRLPTDRLKELTIAFPPTREEQQSIVDSIEERIKQVGAAEECVKRQTAFVCDYRARLVTDVVTGRVDVREAVAGLPDEDGEPGEMPLADVILEEAGEADPGMDDLVEEVAE
jgi:type I restriction enzyme, S subunit